MPRFSVTYRDKTGTLRTTGKGGLAHFDAGGISEVYQRVRADGGSVVSIDEIRVGGIKKWLRSLTMLDINLKFSASFDEYAMLCDVLGALLSSGVAVLRAMNLTSAECDNRWLGKKLQKVAENVENGSPLSKAMEDQGKSFPINLVSAVRAGEQIGEVPKSLSNMADLFRRKAMIKRETVSALIYPMLATIVFIVVCVIITIKVPEALQEAIGSPDAVDKIMPKLPAIIRLLFFLKSNPVYLVSPFIVAGIVFGLVKLGQQFYTTKLMIARAARKIFIIGPMRAEFALVDFLESVSMNQESGIKIGESLELIQKTTTDPLIEDAVVRVRQRIIQNGQSLSRSIADETVFPGLVRQMVASAEEGGHLAAMLRPIAEYYGLRARASLKRMIDSMTPAMIILLGSVIGPLVIGVYKTLIIMQKEVGGGGGV